MKNSIIFGAVGWVAVVIAHLADEIGFFVFVGLLILIGAIALLWNNIENQLERKEQKKKLNGDLDAIVGFHSTNRLVGAWGLIAIDNNSGQIAVKEESSEIRLYPYASVLSCEIIEDDEIVYKKESSIGRALVGGVLAGGTGAIIGSLSSKEKQDREVKQLDFKIVFKDTNKPSFSVRFFDAWEETGQRQIKPSDGLYGHIYKEALASLTKWKDIIEIIIDGSDAAESSNGDANPAAETDSTSLSIADELSKLHGLKTEGVITEEEFNNQKQRLLK